jgi:hypothetical protein
MEPLNFEADTSGSAGPQPHPLVEDDRARVWGRRRVVKGERLAPLGAPSLHVPTATATSTNASPALPTLLSRTHL